jgi:hypothetical protein
MPKASRGKGLRPPKKAAELLNMYYLDARCHLLETAAILDRIQRAEGGRKAMKDARIRRLMTACELLKGERSGRAERFLSLFSEPHT